MIKSEAFIEDRIRWRGAQHQLPSPKTYYWESASSLLKKNLELDQGKPVLVSEQSKDNLVVICTQGLIFKTDGLTSSIAYSLINTIDSPRMEEGEAKSELSSLILELKNGDEKLIRPEKYEKAFTVWNILLMLQKLS